MHVCIYAFMNVCLDVIYYFGHSCTNNADTSHLELLRFYSEWCAGVPFKATFGVPRRGGARGQVDLSICIYI